MQKFVFLNNSFLLLSYNMDIVSFLLDVFRLVLAGAILVALIFFIFKGYFDRYQNIQFRNYKIALNKDLLPLKLQALERITLFIERINPSNLLLRIHTPGMTAKQMQFLVLEDIRAEYQHNVTQQLYLSTEAWAIVKRVKDDTVSLINSSVMELHPETSAVELSKIVFAKLESLDQNPYDLATMVIKSQYQEL
ncbi:hypothetical protein Pedsa_3852 [Pseudopedobacter saltans DSM 12145]|uniref:Uncharacterized protein n=1 Tax=Pseudopedobacter saltans (strain ATCC 51119 / DSM 12145 / JCM 21818 / CCUG 39354 / LMG 10337 / NBRC 100064 / NCIMB 13643) TaxID=762903 RepID=F0S7X2_PSESL|nr:hypothetical protein [Pseudopedobacter saltans]ADY54380.1 hypothetical protein Pedsa_3852 [Pseudopedobacter saltans DSM 12145]